MCETVESWLRTWSRILFMDRRDNLKRRPFWQFQIVGFGGFYLSNLLGSIPQLMSTHDSLREETVPVFVMFLASCALHPVCRRLWGRSQSWVALELKASAWAVVAGILCAGATGVALWGFHDVNWFGLAPIMVWSASVLFIWCSLYFSIKQWQQSTEEKQRLLRAETEVREARLLALRYQLNPHFLFNSLEAVSTLILDGNGLAATEMLAQIGDLLRSSLDSEIKAEVPLSKEIQFTEMYLAIEQTRLGERLTFELTVPAETRDALVPSMLLQPLVENAVRYGVTPLVEGGWIEIRSVLESDKLRIVIGNSGRWREGEKGRNGNRVGLGNTVERLKTLYGANHKFLLEWPESGGCQVTVEIPFRTTRDREEVAPCAH
jgi:two-component system LytT family sensor kinase